MALVIAGIDEAGYGPMLGPLVVARSVLRVRDWQPGQPAPDLWKLLASAVTSKPNDPRHRIAIADSKKLKKPNDTPDPLQLLRRGVAAMLAQVVQAAHVPQQSQHEPLPSSDLSTDEALLCSLGFKPLPQPWYATPADPGPHASSHASSRAIDANRLAGAMHDAGVELLELRVHVTDESSFNTLIDLHHTKAATTANALAHHLQHIWTTYATTDDGPRVVCDRQGGRQAYGNDLYAILPDVHRAGLEGSGGVTMLEETPERSRYLCEATVNARPARLAASFQTQGESHHLPIALASMAAKLTRELLMQRFNAHWSSRARAVGLELKPTAGYVQDARRWLADASTLLTKESREALVRKA